MLDGSKVIRGRDFRWDSVPLREYKQDGLGGVCLDGEWDYITPNTESCATAEGWASYVAAVSWYNPNDSGADPEVGGMTLNVERATPWRWDDCEANRGLPIQAVKGFWDLDDANNEDGYGVAGENDDSMNYTSTTLLDYWDKFPSGSDNREDEEADADGPNLWDYGWNAWNTGSGWGPFENYETLLYHNCTGAQDFN